MISSALGVIASTALGVGILCGSVPFGVLISRYGYGVDLRAHGSGNIGAANAMRTIGKTGAALVLLLDAAKGALPVIIMQSFSRTHAPGLTLSAEFAAGAGAMLGHCFTPWLNFKGGKGIATALGILLILAWPVGIIALFCYGLVAKLTRVSALGSLSAAVVGAVGLSFTLGRPGASYGIASLILIFYTHRSNVARLRQGHEWTLAAPPRNGPPA